MNFNEAAAMSKFGVFDKRKVESEQHVSKMSPTRKVGEILQTTEILDDLKILIRSARCLLIKIIGFYFEEHAKKCPTR